MTAERQISQFGNGIQNYDDQGQERRCINLLESRGSPIFCLRPGLVATPAEGQVFKLNPQVPVPKRSHYVRKIGRGV